MVHSQGIACLYLRKGVLLVVAGSLAEGARPDERGIWTGLTVVDFEAASLRVSADSADSTLGATLRDALVRARIGIPAPASWAKGIGSDKRGDDLRLAEAMGLPDARGMYPGMKACFARWELGELMIMPTKRLHGGRFEGFAPPWQDQHPDVLLPFASSDEALGGAIRMCFSRCL